MTSLRDPERLAALERSGLMRHAQDQRLNHLCYTAQQLLQCDAVQLNVITESEQHYIAEWPRAAPRSPIRVADAGCREVILASEPVVVPNTIEHPVMCQMPWVATWGGYLGVPLGGLLPIGSMCALTHQPREWSQQDVLALRSIGDLVLSSIA